MENDIEMLQGLASGVLTIAKILAALESGGLEGNRPAVIANLLRRGGLDSGLVDVIKVNSKDIENFKHRFTMDNIPYAVVNDVNGDAWILVDDKNKAEAQKETNQINGSRAENNPTCSLDTFLGSTHSETVFKIDVKNSPMDNYFAKLIRAKSIRADGFNTCEQGAELYFTQQDRNNSLGATLLEASLEYQDKFLSNIKRNNLEREERFDPVAGIKSTGDPIFYSDELNNESYYIAIESRANKNNGQNERAIVFYDYKGNEQEMRFYSQFVDDKGQLNETAVCNYFRSLSQRIHNVHEFKTGNGVDGKLETAQMRFDKYKSKLPEDVKKYASDGNIAEETLNSIKSLNVPADIGMQLNHYISLSDTDLDRLTAYATKQHDADGVNTIAELKKRRQTVAEYVKSFKQQYNFSSLGSASERADAQLKAYVEFMAKISPAHEQFAQQLVSSIFVCDNKGDVISNAMADTSMPTPTM